MTNPNPVAPKTDTPATQIPEDLNFSYGVLKAHIEARRSRFTTSTEFLISLIERLGTAESTLAAERASRVQAEDQAFNAGIERAAQYVATMAAYPYANPLTDDTKSILGLMPNGIRNCAKPSVSPEQDGEAGK